jgi:hypothetical protein
MGKFEVSETVEAKTGFYVSKKVAIIGAIVITTAIVASVLVTFFAKSSTCPDINSECQSLACQKPSLVQSKNFE